MKTSTLLTALFLLAAPLPRAYAEDPAPVLARAKQASGGEAWDVKTLYARAKVSTGGLDGTASPGKTCGPAVSSPPSSWVPSREPTGSTARSCGLRTPPARPGRTTAATAAKGPPMTLTGGLSPTGSPNGTRPRSPTPGRRPRAAGRSRCGWAPRQASPTAKDLLLPEVRDRFKTSAPGTNVRLTVKSGDGTRDVTLVLRDLV